MSVDPVISAYFSRLGKLSASGMSADKRRERARAAASRRWAGHTMLTVSKSMLTVSNPILTSKHTPANDLDKCSNCGRPRYKHGKYNDNPCKVYQA